MYRPTIILMLMLLLFGCRGGIDFQKPLHVTGDDSFQYASGPERSHYSDARLAPPMVLQWTSTLSNGISESHPAADEHVIFIPTLTQGIDIYDIRTGDELGYMSLNGVVLGTPAAKDSRIYIPLSGGVVSLLEISAATGEVLSEVRDEPVELPLLVLTDRIITAGIFGTVSCYKQGDSSAQWSVKLPKPALGAPCGTGDKVFVSASNGDLYAFGLDNGNELWRLHTGAAIHASPVTDGNLVIAVNRDGECFAVNASTGAVIWTKSLGVSVFSPPALHNGLLIIPGTDGKLRAYTSMDGAERWTYSFGGLPAASPVITSSHVAAASMNGTIVLLDRQNGELLWTSTVKGRIRTAPIVRGTMLCIVSEEGKLYGFSSDK